MASLRTFSARVVTGLWPVRRAQIAGKLKIKTGDLPYGVPSNSGQSRSAVTR